MEGLPYLPNTISIHAPRVGSDHSFCPSFDKLRISIHAPRVGSDFLPAKAKPGQGNFNPRSPCGERHLRATIQILDVIISIHAPRVGSDGYAEPAEDTELLFQSTLPVWGATKAAGGSVSAFAISIHAPRVGSDSRNIQRYSRKKYMILCIAQNLKCLLLLIAPFLEYFTTFSQKSGANLPEKPCVLFLRTTIKSWAPPGDKCFYSRNVQFFSRIDFPGNKTAGCPFPGP